LAPGVCRHRAEEEHGRAEELDERAKVGGLDLPDFAVVVDEFDADGPFSAPDADVHACARAEVALVEFDAACIAAGVSRPGSPTPPTRPVERLTGEEVTGRCRVGSVASPARWRPRGAPTPSARR
jgi:hypothetical protein